MVLDPKSLVQAKEYIYVRPLTLKDLDAVMAVETQAFVPAERCTRKQFHALLSTALSPSLSLGIFASTSPSQGAHGQPHPHNPTEHLLGHAIASKITSHLITDSCYSSSTTTSHNTGATIALHSLAIVPACQRRTLGTTLMVEFIRKCLHVSVSVERIAIIAREGLVRFYERFGFECRGLSSVGFGGGGWRNLVLEFEKRGEIEKRGGGRVVMAGCGGGVGGVTWSMPLVN
ncbi:hypothetical protein DFP73DRAFT_255583 [Morchella snyderi]|nr:hypothetical protein DFP73DRAFT_255583 [Morchella snyderi]